MSHIHSLRIGDRRSSPRVRNPFDGHCSTQSGRRPVRISDLSVTGCFVESMEPLATGTCLDLTIEIAAWGPLSVSAEVVYASPPMGFGVRFVDVPAESAEVLQKTVDSFLDETSA